MAAEEQAITEEQATAALNQLMQNGGDEPPPDESGDKAEFVPEYQRTAQDQAAGEPEQAQQAAPEGDEPADPTTSDQEPEPEAPTVSVEDVEERWQKKMSAIQQRNDENIEVLRKRFLQKATVGDKMAKALEAALSEQGISPEQARQVIAEYRSTLNPASVGYEPTQPQAPQPPQNAGGNEDQMMIFNQFLNEKGMDADEAQEFGNWIRTEGSNALTPRQLGYAQENLGAFLDLAYGAYQGASKEADKQVRRDAATQAAQSVRRTQRAAVKAAAAQTTAPRKNPVAPKQEIDVSKLSSDDVAKLFRMSVEQHR